MSNVAKLKKQAADFELKKQFDKALAVYVKVLEEFDQHAEELDVALFNRVGDLMLRQGNVADAVDYYERAVDRYAEGGFFNNAIALCNKILRQSPGRTSIYYKLGKISAQQGFTTDAKRNFLEYADRMQKSGRKDEAFRALTEFADLCPDQDDIRLMLADQLMKAGRKDEALEQFQTLYARYEADGRHSDAAGTLARMRTIDPAVVPRTGADVHEVSGGDLIFLDLDESPRAPAQTATAEKAAAPKPPAAKTAPPSDVPREQPVAREIPVPRAATPATTVPAAPQPPAQSTPVAPPTSGAIEGITRTNDGGSFVENTGAESLLGLESTSLVHQSPAGAAPPIGTPSILDFEPTTVTPSSAPAVQRSSAPTHGMQDREIDEKAGGDLDIIMPEETSAEPHQPPSLDFELATFEPTPAKSAPAQPSVPKRPSVSVPQDLELMDLEVPVEPEESAQARRSSPDVFFGSSFTPIEPTFNAIERTRGAPGVEEDEPFVMPTPSIARKSTLVAARSVELLRESVDAEPENWTLRRELAEAMLEAGDRVGGLQELDAAMLGAEGAGDLDLASAIAEEIARLEPDVVRHHQKRVEYAFRVNDRGRLIEAYLALADSLLRVEQIDKARTIYHRVLELAPDELRASTALESIGPAAPEPAPAPPPRRSSTVPPRASAGSARTPPGRKATLAPATADDSDFVNLGEWLLDDEPAADTRMVVQEQEPTGDEDADFADMLRKFKQGVAQNVDAEDYQSHYDLAIAYKEMGLVDEAIHEFQKALGSPTNRLPTYEALGQCFVEKGQFKMAYAILTRALSEQASEEQLLGVLYLLGRAAEEQGEAHEALGYYQRVCVLDIKFRDIAERMAALESALR